jgi:hypothetical protein
LGAASEGVGANFPALHSVHLLISLFGKDPLSQSVHVVDPELLTVPAEQEAQLACFAASDFFPAGQLSQALVPSEKNPGMQLTQAMPRLV